MSLVRVLLEKSQCPPTSIAMQPALGHLTPDSKITWSKSGQRKLKDAAGEPLLAKLGINSVFQSLMATGWVEEVRRVESRGNLWE